MNESVSAGKRYGGGKGVKDDRHQAHRRQCQENKKVIDEDRFKKFEILQRYERVLDCLEGGRDLCLRSWSDFREEEWEKYREDLEKGYQNRMRDLVGLEFLEDKMRDVLRRSYGVCPLRYGSVRRQGTLEFDEVDDMNRYLVDFPMSSSFCRVRPRVIVIDVSVRDVVCEKPVLIKFDEIDDRIQIMFKNALNFHLDLDKKLAIASVRDQVGVMRQIQNFASGRRGFFCATCGVCLNDPVNCDRSSNVRGGECNQCKSHVIEFMSLVSKSTFGVMTRVLDDEPSGFDFRACSSYIKCSWCLQLSVDLKCFIRSKLHKSRYQCDLCRVKFKIKLFDVGVNLLDDLMFNRDIANKVIFLARSWVTLMQVSKLMCHLVCVHISELRVPPHYYRDAIKSFEETMEESNSEDYLDEDITVDRCVTQILQLPLYYFVVDKRIEWISVGPAMVEHARLHPMVFRLVHPYRIDVNFLECNRYTAEELLPIVLFIDWIDAFAYSGYESLFYAFLQPHFKYYLRKHHSKLKTDFDCDVYVHQFYRGMRVFSADELMASSEFDIDPGFYRLWRYLLDLPSDDLFVVRASEIQLCFQQLFGFVIGKIFV